MGQIGGRVARELNKLNALKVSRCADAGYYHDGGGLYLQVTPRNNKSWVFRYSRLGKAREMGLGPLRLVSLSDARLKRDDLKKVILSGLDPLSEKIKAEKLQVLIGLKKVNFESCAAMYIEMHKNTWKNQKHHMQWLSTLKSYAFPTIGKMAVDEIETAHIVKIIEPIWMEKTETANRVRNRIELILNWSTVRGYRAGENPARWRGHLDQLLPRKSQIKKVEHMRALSYPLISNFISNLKLHSCSSSLALQFLILTATRTCESLGAQWNEFDFQKNVWTIPASRMKSKREHQVPLSDRALEILNSIPKDDLSPIVFKNLSNRRQLSSNAILALLHRLGYDITTHGFRSTFRDWVSEETQYSREVAEASLSHSLRDKVEAAYRRGDFFKKRKMLMDEWADYCYSNSERGYLEKRIS